MKAVLSAEPGAGLWVRDRGAVRSSAAAALVVCAAGIAAAADPDAIDDGPVICPFRLMTGLPCPGCGLTRSWVYAVHGQWGDSIAANPFGIVALVAGLVFAFAVGVALVRRRRPPDVVRVVDSRPFWAVGALWIGFGLVRLAVAAT